MGYSWNDSMMDFPRNELYYIVIITGMENDYISIGKMWDTCGIIYELEMIWW